jgi:hypothetical protein
MPTKQSLPAVTIAGVVAIALSLFGILLSLIGAVSMLLLPQLSAGGGAPPLPATARVMSELVMIVMFAMAVFGIFVGVGVIRRRNWARISILVWGGIMALLCLAIVGFSLVIFSSGMGINLPNTGGADTGQVMLFTKIFMVIFYGIPAAIGIWWLVLFTRPRVAEAFTTPALAVPARDASGFPKLPDAVLAGQPKRPACPIPLVILAGFLIVGSVFMALLLLVPVPADMPFFLFGHPFYGTAPKMFVILLGVTSGVAGIGMLKLKAWALYGEVVLQVVGLANCLATVLSPNYTRVMRAAMASMAGQNPAFAGANPMLSDTYINSSMIFAVVFIVAALAVLLWQRARFLEQAAAAANA